MELAMVDEVHRLQAEKVLVFFVAARESHALFANAR